MTLKVAQLQLWLASHADVLRGSSRVKKICMEGQAVAS